jgi:hypothetical protein
MHRWRRLVLFGVIHKSISVAYHCPRVTSRARQAFRTASRFDRTRQYFCQRASGGLPRGAFGT